MVVKQKRRITIYSYIVVSIRVIFQEKLITGAFSGLSQDRLDTMCLLLQVVLDHKLVQNTCPKLAFVQRCSFGEVDLALCA